MPPHTRRVMYRSTVRSAHACMRIGCRMVLAIDGMTTVCTHARPQDSPADIDALVVAGHSMGGHGVWLFAALEPGRTLCTLDLGLFFPTNNRPVRTRSLVCPTHTAAPPRTAKRLRALHACRMPIGDAFTS